jgi:hypothetical protein
MTGLPDRLQELADFAERAGQSAGAVAAARRGRRRQRRRAVAGVSLLAGVLVAGGVLADRLPGGLGRPPDRRPAAPAVQAPRVPLAPPSYAEDVHRRYAGHLVDMSPVVLLGRGRDGGYTWRMAAVWGIQQATNRPETCLVWEADGADHPSGSQCAVASARNITLDLELRDRPAPVHGMVPARTARVRLLLQGRPPVEVAAIDPGHGFRQRFYLASPDAAVVGVVALDAQGRQLARLRRPRP